LKAIILAGGYGRRLYPLTENRPKPLLLVAGKPMLERVLESLAPIHELKVAYVVTNEEFYQQFRNWRNTYIGNNSHFQIEIINNRCMDRSHEIGALGNLHIVLKEQNVDDDIMVIAADNLFSKSLEDFAAFAVTKNAPVVATYNVDDVAEVRRFGSVVFDAAGRISFFEEKPAAPSSPTIAVALYYYPRTYLPLIGRYVAEHNNTEEPGRLIEWMYRQVTVYAWPVPGIWCDVGSHDSLNYANRMFTEAEGAAG
jgi:glucose-1-phosphate thymidylyltransferase